MNLNKSTKQFLFGSSDNQIEYDDYRWDSRFLKKFVTTKWPYEMYKGNFFEDLLSIFSSHDSRFGNDKHELR